RNPDIAKRWAWRRRARSRWIQRSEPRQASVAPSVRRIEGEKEDRPPHGRRRSARDRSETCLVLPELAADRSSRDRPGEEGSDGPSPAPASARFFLTELRQRHRSASAPNWGQKRQELSVSSPAERPSGGSPFLPGRSPNRQA